MKQNYFIVNGKKYYTGTVFIIKDYAGEQVEASFICYDMDYAKYVYKIKGCIWRLGDKTFWNRFVSITNKQDNNVHMPVVKTKKDFEINGLFIGWVWYIFLMSISVIFKDAIGLWILISTTNSNLRFMRNAGHNI